jgi:anti-anti-sigma regulatory factor
MFSISDGTKQGMALEVLERDGVLSISLVGVFDAANSIGLAESLSWHSARHQFWSVVIDLSRCPDIGSRAFSGLVGFRLHPRVLAKPVSIQGCSTVLQERLDALYLDRLFDVPVTR